MQPLEKSLLNRLESTIKIARTVAGITNKITVDVEPLTGKR